MDLGRDILRLVEKVANVPGLSMAFSLAREISEIISRHDLTFAPHDLIVGMSQSLSIADFS